MSLAPSNEAQVASGAPLPRSVWILSWVSFFADISSELVYPLLPLFLTSVLGSSKTEIGAMEGGASLLVALLAAWAGFRSDGRGRGAARVPWIRWGYGLPVAGKALIAVATSWGAVLGGRWLDRFGKGLRGAPRDALLADMTASAQRGRAFGLHRAFDTAGALLGVLLSAFLLWLFTGAPNANQGAGAAQAIAETPEWAYRGLFALSSALGLASLALTFWIQEGVKPAVPTQQRADAEPARLNRSYWTSLGVLLLYSLANSSDMFLLTKVRDLGFAPWQVVGAYALFNLVYAALSYPAGAWSDRWGRWRILAVGWGIYGGVYCGFALLAPRHAWGVWPLMGAYGACAALTDGVGKALIADHIPGNLRGTGMGIFYALTGATALVASLLVGAVWDSAGSKSALFVSAGFAGAALGTLIFLRLLKAI